MRILNRKFLLACAGLLLSGSLLAQPGPGAGGGMGPGMMGPGAGAAHRPCMKGTAPADATGPNCNWRMNRRNSAAYGLMTPEERRAHQERIRGFKSREECVAYVTEHHAQMAERAKEKGQTLPEPRHRFCDRLPAAR